MSRSPPFCDAFPENSSSALKFGVAKFILSEDAMVVNFSLQVVVHAKHHRFG
jgi:hypothetical protein